jgi:hypothetical protein
MQRARFEFQVAKHAFEPLTPYHGKAAILAAMLDPAGPYVRFRTTGKVPPHPKSDMDILGLAAKSSDRASRLSAARSATLELGHAWSFFCQGETVVSNPALNRLEQSAKEIAKSLGADLSHFERPMEVAVHEHLTADSAESIASYALKVLGSLADSEEKDSVSDSSWAILVLALVAGGGLLTTMAFRLSMKILKMLAKDLTKYAAYPQTFQRVHRKG